MLVAEPHKELREALKQRLGDAMTVLAAQTSNGAIVGFEHHQPLVLLLAMKQPDCTGLELCARIRKMPGGTRPWICVYGKHPDLTEGVLEGDLKARYGVSSYLPTGVTLKRLDKLVRDQLRGTWRPAPELAMDAGAAATAESTDPRWNNPMLTTDALSARKEPEKKKRFDLRRLFGSFFGS